MSKLDERAKISWGVKSNPKSCNRGVRIWPTYTTTTGVMRLDRLIMERRPKKKPPGAGGRGTSGIDNPPGVREEHMEGKGGKKSSVSIPHSDI